MSTSMREMLEAGVHFGHQTRFWNPKMAPYIFGYATRHPITRRKPKSPEVSTRGPRLPALENIVRLPASDILHNGGHFGGVQSISELVVHSKAAFRLRLAVIGQSTVRSHWKKTDIVLAD